MLLLPQDLREWVPEGHLAHHVSDLVDVGWNQTIRVFLSNALWEHELGP